MSTFEVAIDVWALGRGGDPIFIFSAISSYFALFSSFSSAQRSSISAAFIL